MLYLLRYKLVKRCLRTLFNEEIQKTRAERWYLLNIYKTSLAIPLQQLFNNLSKSFSYVHLPNCFMRQQHTYGMPQSARFKFYFFCYHHFAYTIYLTEIEENHEYSQIICERKCISRSLYWNSLHPIIIFIH